MHTPRRRSANPLRFSHGQSDLDGHLRSHGGDNAFADYFGGRSHDCPHARRDASEDSIGHPWDLAQQAERNADGGVLPGAGADC